MTIRSTVPLALLTLATLSLGRSYAQSAPTTPSRRVIIPDTTVPQPGDEGQHAHTNHLILAQPDGGQGPGGGMAPWQLQSFYNMPASGGSGVIAIVDAYHYPSSLNDFNVFSRQFGLPVETSTNPLASSNSVFQVVYASRKQPQSNGGWSQETALDIEWAHAMAPGAKIVLVEAASASYSDLFAAVDKASSLPGVVEVSMSWGSGEFSGETSYDSHFQHSGIVYFASSGDTGGVVEYPAASPYVVAAGGTSVSTDSSGQFTGETGWSGSGGGVSLYEGKPSYQGGIGASRRAVPDLSSDADPYTGVSVYDSTAYQGKSGWMVFGGTSVASPCLAAMTNTSGHTSTSSYQELTKIYTNLGSSSYSTDYRDITQGSAGSFTCAPGWDPVNGVGSPINTAGL